MKYTTTSVLLALGALAALAALAAAEKLVFNEDFNTLDQSKWRHDVSAWRGGNFEFQYYRNSRNNSYVRGGTLFIKPTLTADEYGEDFVLHGKLSYPDCNREPCVSEAGSEIVLPVLSARISSVFSFKYGRLEVRARMPKGDWLWPAIWLLPEDDVYGGWPRSGEMDLVESRGNRRLFDSQGKQDGIRFLSSTLHWGPAPGTNGFRKTLYVKNMNSDTLADDFHVYTLDWRESGIRFLIDGQLIGERPTPQEGFWKLGGFQGNDIWGSKKLAPFDQNFYIIINLAVGGNFFSDGLRNEPHPRPYDLKSGQAMRQFWEKKDWWKDTWKGESAALQVDYVRVYQ